MQEKFKITPSVFLFFVLAGAVVLVHVMCIRNNIARVIAKFNDEAEDSRNITLVASEIMQYKDEIDKPVKILNFINHANSEQTMHNNKMVGLTGPVFFIIIHVNNDYPRFYQLMVSLSRVNGITRSLLIFAHECYDERINNLIKSFEFSRYIQIFYPYSMQLIPDSFPGHDNKFCKDAYHCVLESYTRNATLAHRKHFWWWMVNFVFENLTYLRHNPHYYLFLRHDQYVADDLIFMLDRMRTLMHSNCPQCEIMNLGSRRPDAKQFHVHTAKFYIEAFGSAEFNYAIAFNRSLWHKIKDQRRDFCYFEDYRWDESLKHVASKMPSGSIETLSIEGPRVLTTVCDDEKPCNVTEKLSEARTFFKLVIRGLFPLLLEVNDGEINTNISAAGNWTDVRDKELCMFFTEKNQLKFNI